MVGPRGWNYECYFRQSFKVSSKYSAFFSLSILLTRLSLSQSYVLLHSTKPWNYPLTESLLRSIILPEVQGFLIPGHSSEKLASASSIPRVSLQAKVFWQSYSSLRTDKLRLKSKPGRLASIHLSPRIQHQELSEPSLCLFSPLQQPQKSARSDDKNRKNRECEAALRLFKPWTRTSPSVLLPMQQTLLTKSHLWLTDVSDVFSRTLLVLKHFCLWRNMFYPSFL